MQANRAGRATDKIMLMAWASISYLTLRVKSWFLQMIIQIEKKRQIPADCINMFEYRRGFSLRCIEGTFGFVLWFRNSCPIECFFSAMCKLDPKFQQQHRRRYKLTRDLLRDRTKLRTCFYVKCVILCENLLWSWQWHPTVSRWFGS